MEEMETNNGYYNRLNERLNDTVVIIDSTKVSGKSKTRFGRWFSSGIALTTINFRWNFMDTGILGFGRSHGWFRTQGKVVWPLGVGL